MICEPSDDVRHLLELFVRRFGHEPVLCGSTWSGDLSEVEVVLLDPTSAKAASVVWAVQHASPTLPVICVSVYPRTNQVAVPPCSAYLEKPFTFDELTRAVGAALGHAPAPTPLAAAAAPVG